MGFRKFESDADVATFARAHTDFFASGDVLNVTEIGDGNINYVYRVADDKGHSLIIKQALPYIRIIGEGWPLSQDRIRIEADALRLAAESCPDLVPAVYHYDDRLCAIVMEDIGEHQNLRHAFIERQCLPDLAADLGRFLADSLFFTSDLYLDTHQKKTLVARFINPDLCKISEELFFQDPYCDHERNSINDELRADAEALWVDEPLKLEVAKLKAAFVSQPEAMLHGDLHSGSVFASGTGTKIIDPEFSFFGPMAFDIGSILGNYLLNYAGQTGLPGDRAERLSYQAWLLRGFEQLWRDFESRFLSHAQQHCKDPVFASADYHAWRLQQIFSDSLGYAGTEIIRRTIGLSHVADIELIEDSQQRTEAERLALKLGRGLLLQRECFKDVQAVTRWISE
ncbi:MAG: S-methyl-5-thioribose kinase [Pontibacterium sp.]